MCISAVCDSFNCKQEVFTLIVKTICKNNYRNMVDILKTLNFTYDIFSYLIYPIHTQIEPQDWAAIYHKPLWISFAF